MNKDIQNYIEEAKSRGHSDREIRSKLITSGWHPNKVYSMLPIKKSNDLKIFASILIILAIITILPFIQSNITGLALGIMPVEDVNETLEPEIPEEIEVPVEEEPIEDETPQNITIPEPPKIAIKGLKIMGGAVDDIGIAWLQGDRDTDGSTILNKDTNWDIFNWSNRNFDTNYYAANESCINVTQAGDYLVALTVPSNRTTLLEEAVRQSIETVITINGALTQINTVGASSYNRGNQSASPDTHKYSSNNLNVLLEDLNVDDCIGAQVRLSTTDTQQDIEAAGMGGFSMYVEYISASERVFTGYTTVTNGTLPTNMNPSTEAFLNWTEGRKDTGYTHTDSVPSITIASAGNYLVFVNVPIYDAAGARQSPVIKVYLNGSAVTGAAARQGHRRGTSGINQSSIHFGGIIEVSANDVLTVGIKNDATSTESVTTGSYNATIYVQRLPSTGVYLGQATQVADANDWNPATPAEINWSTDDVIDTDVYTHSTSTSNHQITVDEDGYYLLIYNDNLATVSGVRDNPQMRVYVNGVYQPGAWTGSHYIRNAGGLLRSSTTLTYLLNLSANDNVSINVMRDDTISAHTINDQTPALLGIIKKEVDTPPLIDVTFPQNNTNVNASWMNITGTASDNKLPDTVWINDTTNFGTNEGTYANWNFTNTTPLANGEYHINITANDTAGNQNSTIIVFNFTYTAPPDKTPPVINLESPTDDSISTSVNVTFEYNVTDVDSGIINCSVWTNSTGNWALNASNSTPVKETTPDQQINISDFPRTTFIWNVECYDNATTPNSAFAANNYTLTVYTYLNVTLLTPNPSICNQTNPCNLTQNEFFWVNATVRCEGTAGANCGGVTGTSRYNSTINWLTGWIYRKSHNITDAGANYKVKIRAYYGRKNDSGENVSLNSHSQVDFDDVRFTDDSGVTELTYSLNSTSYSEVLRVGETYSNAGTGSAAYYSGTYNRTYYVWLNTSDAVSIIYYDYDTNEWSTPQQIVASIPPDIYGTPKILFNDSGGLIVFYGAHANFRHKISTNAENITSWGSEKTIFDYFNYPHPIQNSSGDIWLFGMHGDPGATHKRWRQLYVTSSDNGQTWSGQTFIINISNSSVGDDEQDTMYCPPEVVIGTDDSIHIACMLHDHSESYRRSVYYMWRDPSDGNWKKRDGTIITLPANKSTIDLVYNSLPNGTSVRDIQLDSNNNPYILFWDGINVDGASVINGSWKFAKFNDTSNSWEISKIAYSGVDGYWDMGQLRLEDSAFYAYINRFGVAGYRGGEIEEHISTDNGTTWSLNKNITSSSAYRNSDLVTVRNGSSAAEAPPEVKLIWHTSDPQPSDVYYYGDTTISATFWVETGTLNAAANQTIYIYYGNSLVNTTSSSINNSLTEANHSSWGPEETAETMIAINTTIGALPFYTINNQPQTCGFLIKGQSCQLNWSVNATGTKYWKIDVNFVSNESSVLSNDTDDAIVNILDITPPVITLISPEQNYISTSTSVTFSYNVTDFSDVANCSLIINDTVDQTDSSITEDTTQTFSKTGFAIGYYFWSVNCTDEFSNQDSSEARNITILAQAATYTPENPYQSSGYNVGEVINESSEVITEEPSNITVEENITEEQIEKEFWFNIGYVSGFSILIIIILLTIYSILRWYYKKKRDGNLYKAQN